MFNSIETGGQIAYFRKQNRLTQDELAEHLHVSPQAISKWENGRAMPEVSLLAELSETLGCTTDELLFPGRYQNLHGKYIHQLLPYQDVDPYSGEHWPRSMAFPAVMTALKLFMGLEERRNLNNHQVNDDQEYVLQSGISTLAFGFSHYNAEFIHDCFLIYGLDYRTESTDNKPFDEITLCIQEQIQRGYPVIVQDKSNNAAFLFITGITSNGQTIRAHNFIEGMDENNFNMNPYEMKSMDNWLKLGMELILLSPANRLSVETACQNALNHYCMMMFGEWDRDTFCSPETPEPFRQFMAYGSDGYCRHIGYLQRKGTLEGFYPQQCIIYESHLRTLGFLKMCKELMKDIDKQSMNAAIDRYQVLRDHTWEIINISWNDPTHTEPETEKAKEITNILIRSNEIFIDAANDIKKAVGYLPSLTRNK